MKQIILLILIIASINVNAQKKYFQQDVDYKIEVALDDENHILRGKETIHYKNNSNDTLRFILFHLWANAYKNDKSTYTEHEVENRDTKFYYSMEEQRGFIDSLEFKVDNENVNISNFNNLEDVILVELNHPLFPNEQIEINTPFRLVIPEVFSRLGHDEQDYQISQWYPKPAVYDNKGWHPMPYLDQGEFYSEFGEFDIHITVPKNYIVAATGVLKNESEKQFLAQIKNDTSNRNLVSAKEYKTLHFSQDKVHDFAWFASKEYRIEETSVTLNNGHIVQCTSYFKPKNKKKYEGSSKIIAQTITYYSNLVGDYPYDYASIVDGKLLAGGGMEYPMVTVIGNVNNKAELQTVIVHEVGHNWFQGILGSNERDHAWMDEGMNSFYENKVDHIIDKLNAEEKEGKIQKLTKELNGNFIYQIAAKQKEDQIINSPAAEFTSINYGGCVYYKTAALFAYLENYLGTEIFNKAMRKYYETWKHKHPYPEDFRSVIEAVAGKKLDWFFEDGLNSTKKIDYKIKVKKEKNQYVISATNKKDFKGPIPINAMIKDSIAETKWIEYPYQNAVSFTDNDKITAYKIDGNYSLPEINITNNFYEKNKLFPRFKFKPQLGTEFRVSDKNKVFLLPAYGYNYYNKAMLGLAIHNLKIPNNQFQFAFAPTYSFGSKSLVGSGVIGYSFYPKNIFQKVIIGLQGNTYHHKRSNLNASKYIFARHIKISPSILFEFKKPTLRNLITKTFLLQYFNISNQNFNYTLNPADSLYRSNLSNFETAHYALLEYKHNNERTFNPFDYAIKAEGNNSFAKLTLTTHLKINYNVKNKAFYVRGFAGKFFDFKNNANPFVLQNQYLNTSFTANNDYAYNDVYLARDEQKGILSNQVSMREGGFKVKTNLLSSPIGVTNNWLTTVNMRTDLPIKSMVKLQLFLDIGTFAEAGKLNPSGNKAIYEAGAELHLFKDVLILYAPLFLSKDLKDYVKTTYSKNRMLQTMSFSLDLNRINFLQTQNVMNLFTP